MKKLVLILTLIVILHLGLLFAQSPGDFRSIVASGNYNAANSWERYSSGGVWQANGVGENNPGKIPTSLNSVFIQTGHVISLTQNEEVNNLNISNGTGAGGLGTDGQLKLVTFTISVYGSLRCYYATLGTIPGTGDNAQTSLIITSAGTSGLVKIVGNSRDFTTNWGAVNPGSTTTYAIEIAMNSGQTATMSKPTKAKDWKITSGILRANASVSTDNGTNGNFSIAPGTVFESSATGTGSNAVLKMTNTTSAGTFTNNGTFRLTGAAPTIAMTTFANNGVVEYTAAGNQTLIAATSSGTNFTTYVDILLSGTNTITLGVNTTINGKLTLAGTASFALGTFTLTYGGASTLEYAGSGVQNALSSEWPLSGGPHNVTINNSNGIVLNSAKAVTGTLTLTSGTITLGNYNLAISGAVVGIPNIIYSGTGSASNAGSASLVSITTSNPGILPSVFSSLTINNSGTATLPNPITIGSLTGTSGSLNLNGNSLSFAGTPYLTFPGTGIVTSLGASETIDTLMPVRINRQWSISGGISSTLYATFTWTASDDNNFVWTGKTPAVYQGVTKLTTISSGLRTITAAISSISAKDIFTIGSESGNVDLPVELSSFTASFSTSQFLVNLLWTTESETNNLGFNILRSNNMNMANAINLNTSIIQGTNTSSHYSYSFSDISVEAPNTYYYWLEYVDYSGISGFSGPVIVQVLAQDDPNLPPVIPTFTKLNNAYPNPFNPETNISFDLKTDSFVDITVFDVKGSRILNLTSKEWNAGTHHLVWNGQDEQGKSVSSGVYFYRMTAGKYQAIQKVVLLK